MQPIRVEDVEISRGEGEVERAARGQGLFTSPRALVAMHVDPDRMGESREFAVIDDVLDVLRHTRIRRRGRPRCRAQKGEIAATRERAKMPWESSESVSKALGSSESVSKAEAAACGLIGRAKQQGVVAV